MNELKKVLSQVVESKDLNLSSQEMQLFSQKVELLSSKSLKDFEKMSAEIQKKYDSSFDGVKKLKEAVLSIKNNSKSARIQSEAFMKEAQGWINQVKALGIEIPKQFYDSMERARVIMDAATKREKTADSVGGMF